MRGSREFLCALVVVAVTAVAATACGGEQDPSPKPVVAAADNPQNALAQSIETCLKERGWAAIAGWDGSISLESPIPIEQGSAYQADYDECLEQGRALAPAETPEFKKARYQKQLEEKECLEAEGYTISEAPSLQTYLDSYAGPDEWFPMQDVDTSAMSMADQKVLFTTCPPPEWY